MRKALIAASPWPPRCSSRRQRPAPPQPRRSCGNPRLREGPARPARLRRATLTVGADNPAFPPWFGGDEKTKPWKVSDPYSGKGYESAVAYAVAKQLGFAKAQVKWTVVPFNNSFRPGKKPFDFYITQVSYTPERAKAVDFSKGYYFVNQSLVGTQGQADRLRALDHRAQEVQARRPGRDDELRLHRQRRSSPTRSRRSTTRTTPPCRRSRTARSTGSSSTCRRRSTSPRVQVSDGKVVGQFAARAARRSASGSSSQKGSKLTAASNKALDRLWANGTIKKLQRIWLAKATGAPVLK